MQTVSEVLNKLLVVGITDLDPDVRYAVLNSFDEQFDPHLAQAENLSALFVTLQVDLVDWITSGLQLADNCFVK